MTNPTPAEIAAGLSEAQRAWIKACDGEAFDSAFMISWRAANGKTFTGSRFAWFAKSRPDIFERKFNYAGTQRIYRLTPLGLAVRAQLRGEG